MKKDKTLVVLALDGTNLSKELVGDFEKLTKSLDLHPLLIDNFFQEPSVKFDCKSLKFIDNKDFRIPVIFRLSRKIVKFV